MFVTQNGKAITVKKFFSRETSIRIDISANPSQIWSLLTRASDYPIWNSTVISIVGSIAMGEEILLKSTLDSKRTFKLKVKDFEENKRLVWGDAMGNRTFTIVPIENGITFSMVEKIGGPLFPLFASMIPSFDSSFEQFASDLKKIAEKHCNYSPEKK